MIRKGDKCGIKAKFEGDVVGQKKNLGETMGENVDGQVQLNGEDEAMNLAGQVLVQVGW